MPRTADASTDHGASEPGKDEFRITEPDGDANRFIIALKSDGRDGSPLPGEEGRFAREGA
jgi:hypothetical protein